MLTVDVAIRADDRGNVLIRFIKGFSAIEYVLTIKKAEKIVEAFAEAARRGAGVVFDPRVGQKIDRRAVPALLDTLRACTARARLIGAEPQGEA